MAKKYYVVWSGHSPGIYKTWDECKRQVHGYTGARYKSFPTLEQAESAFSGKAGGASQANGRSSSGRRGRKTFSAHEVFSHSATVKIFSDGGCEPNPGEAGSGLSVYINNQAKELWYGLYQARGTNNSAELEALKEAMLRASNAAKKGNSVAIFSDSKYAIQCITEWAVKWAGNGWKKAGGEIKNLELIQQCHALYTSLPEGVEVLHVNGHVGVEGNELADRMTMYAIQTRTQGFLQYPSPFEVDAILRMTRG